MESKKTRASLSASYTRPRQKLHQRKRRRLSHAHKMRGGRLSHHSHRERLRNPQQEQHRTSVDGGKFGGSVIEKGKLCFPGATFPSKDAISTSCPKISFFSVAISIPVLLPLLDPPVFLPRSSCVAMVLIRPASRSLSRFAEYPSASVLGIREGGGAHEGVGGHGCGQLFRGETIIPLPQEALEPDWRLVREPDGRHLSTPSRRFLRKRQHGREDCQNEHAFACGSCLVSIYTWCTGADVHPAALKKLSENEARG